MKTRGLLTLPVLLVAVVALALGSVGTAAAGGITKSKVKSLAAKVVAKKASGLSVAHAATAGSATSASNATTVGGLSADALKTRGTRYNLASVSSVTTFDWNLPTAAGTYLAAYNVEATDAGSGSVVCYFTDADGSRLADQYSSRNGSAGFITVSSSALVRVTGSSVTLHCTSPVGNTFSVSGTLPQSTATLVAVDVPSTTGSN